MPEAMDVDVSDPDVVGAVVDGYDADSDDALSTGAGPGRGHRGSIGGTGPRRPQTIYDAVAGRIHLRDPRPPKWADAPARYRDTILDPDEALFRVVEAPVRYEETDPYFAHEALPDGALPDGDLLKAIHDYASRYYEALALQRRRQQRQQRRRRRRPRQDTQAAARGGRPPGEGEGDEDNKDEDKEYEGEDGGGGEDEDGHDAAVVFSRTRLLDERSMDETALLALGILLEEAGRELLGADGDLVFTEAAADGEEDTADDDDDDDNDDNDGNDDAGAAGDAGGWETQPDDGQPAPGA